MKTKRQLKNFVLKTLLPYKQDPSKCGTSDTGTCQYLTSDGKKCAVGRWMKKGWWQDYMGDAVTLEQEVARSGLTLNDILLKEARDMNLSSEEWSELQCYHDSLSRHSNDIMVTRPEVLNKRVDAIEHKFDIELNELRF